ncbi:MAG: pyruvate kinase [bacterium]|nr:pyruvate kinase [bacterium]
MSSTKRTKIVATIGPASEQVAILTQLVAAGMNVCRLNMSHGTHAWHAAAVARIRKVAKQTGEPLAILADLQGPKIRVGELPEAGVTLTQGKPVTFTTGTTRFDGRKIPLTHRALHADVRPGQRILLDDGLIEVLVAKVRERDILCTVVTGGVLTSHKGMNLPETRLRAPAMSPKDRQDAAFAVEHGADWIALSFVREAKDVLQLRRLVRQLGGNQKIIVKIEKPEAIEHFDAILAAADGIMVARGDLGVELPAEEVPIHQKTMIEATRAAGKPVVVATQMLDSMIRNPRPTRAEVSDVANAILDHTDAIMLSGESATGKYPVEAVTMMRRIAEEVEPTALDDITPALAPRGRWDPADVVAESAALLAAHIPQVAGILVATSTGRTARRVARFRPQLPIFAAAPEEQVVRQLNLSYGVIPLRVPMCEGAVFLRHARAALVKRAHIAADAKLIMVTGEPWGQPGSTNRIAVV